MEKKKRERSNPSMSKNKKIWIGGGLTSVIIASALIMNLTNNEITPKEQVKGVSQEEKEAITVDEPKENQEEKSQSKTVKEPQEAAVKETEHAVATSSESPANEDTEPEDLAPKGGPVNPDEVINPATPDRTNEPFDFMYILNHPREFKDAASKGRLLGVNAKIGESYDTVEAHNGELSKYGMFEGAHLFSLGKDYFVSFPESGQGEVLSVNVKRQPPTVKLEQVINVFGEPYYYYSELEEHFYLVYRSGDFVITMRFEGLNELKAEDDQSLTVSAVDLGSYVTTIEIYPASSYSTDPNQQIEYISDNETLDFDEKWFTLAKDKTISSFKIDKLTHTSVEEMLHFNIFVPESTTKEEGKEMANTFLTELTKASEEDLKPLGKSLWDHYKYRVSIYKMSNDNYEYFFGGYGYKGNAGDDSTVMNPNGYPELNW